MRTHVWHTEHNSNQISYLFRKQAKKTEKRRQKNCLRLSEMEIRITLYAYFEARW